MSLRVYVSFDVSSSGAKSKASLSLKIGENTTRNAGEHCRVGAY